MKTTDRVHELFLNYACNAKCPFCYNPPITPELLRRELSFEQAAASLYAGAAAGAKRLNLHGGEVTLRDDLFKILRLAKKMGFADITLVTNGLRLSDPVYLRRLLAAGATHFRLSVHGPDAATHDAILAVPGGFERVLAARENLRREGASFGMNFVLVRSNARTLPAFLRRFCVEDGVADVIVYFPHLRGMMAVNADADGVSYADVVDHVREGARLLDEAGRGEVLWLANFPPCVLPELAPRILDWRREEHAPDLMTHPEGFDEDLGGMKGEQRGQTAACAVCPAVSQCMGVDREYLERFGGEGFVPLAAGWTEPATRGSEAAA